MTDESGGLGRSLQWHGTTPEVLAVALTVLVKGEA